MQPAGTSERRGQTRDININIRVKRTQRDLINHAAELLGKSRSDFILETACREAEDVLLNQCLFTLDADSRHNPRLQLAHICADSAGTRQPNLVAAVCDLPQNRA